MATAAIVGGAGAVGQWIAGLLAPAFHCVILDPATAAPRAGVEQITGDILAPAPVACDLLARADLVVLSVSADIALAVLDRHLGRFRADATVLDMLSVKSAFAERLTAQDPARPCAGFNPMFRPHAGTQGGLVLRSVYRDGGCLPVVAGLLAGAGYRLHDLSADAQDRALAVLQCMTHAAVLGFGAALDTIGAPPPGLATPPYRCLSAVLARVISGAPHVYWEIQRHNVHAAAARRALLNALRTLDQQVADGDAEGFARGYLAVQSALSTTLGSAAEDARHLFAALEQIPRPD